MSFNVLCIMSLEILYGPYWWWWWWFLSLFLYLCLFPLFLSLFFFSGSRPPIEQIANTLTWSRKESFSGTSSPSQTRPWPSQSQKAALPMGRAFIPIGSRGQVRPEVNACIYHLTANPLCLLHVQGCAFVQLVSCLFSFHFSQ